MAVHERGRLLQLLSPSLPLSLARSLSEVPSGTEVAYFNFFSLSLSPSLYPTLSFSLFLSWQCTSEVAYFNFLFKSMCVIRP
jgi:hypothetical protein